MLYDRRIKYLDYYEHGERVRGAGFVKLEVRNGCLRMELSVTGLHPTDVFERDILLCGEKEDGVLGKIMISACLLYKYPSPRDRQKSLMTY